ncbi:transglutaminase family protein [Viridibacterium curvum]
MSTSGLSRYLAHSAVIDCKHPAVAAMAHELTRGLDDEHTKVQRCFEFVRDEIRHSWDYRQGPLTCNASDVLQHRTGYCYAKSHLLAALLRANGIPAALSYQRLSVGDGGAPYCLHGLNAVYLRAHGWYRIDARGNKPGVDARFSPPREALAFSTAEAETHDLPGLFAEPVPAIVASLATHSDIAALHADLPDVTLADWLRLHSEARNAAIPIEAAKAAKAAQR